jgi:double-stranded uracil-DNA glycosylase
VSHTKPTREELAAARDKIVPDVIAPGLAVLFCGINPGLYSGATGHHFARPGNRFWPTLHAAGFTERQLSPFEEKELLPLGYGITNIVNRTTATASELTPSELKEGARHLAKKVLRYEPVTLAILGIEAYRKAFGRPKATLGPQPEQIGTARLWILPNPSGLNAHYQLKDLAEIFRKLRETP